MFDFAIFGLSGTNFIRNVLPVVFTIFGNTLHSTVTEKKLLHSKKVEMFPFNQEKLIITANNLIQAQCAIYYFFMSDSNNSKILGQKLPIIIIVKLEAAEVTSNRLMYITSTWRFCLAKLSMCEQVTILNKTLVSAF